MLKTAKVVGLNSDTDAALVLVTDTALNQQVNLLAVVACEADDAFSKIRQALNEAENVFYTSDEPLSVRVPKCLDLIKEQLTEASNIQILVVAIQEDLSGSVIYLQNFGTSLKAMLVRRHQLTDLSGVGESGLISGVFMEGDRLLLFTPSLKELLGGTLDKITSLPIEMIEDEVSLLMPEAQVNPLACIILEKEVTPKGEILKSLEADEENMESQESSDKSQEKKSRLWTLATSHSFKLPEVNPKLIAIIVIVILLIAGGFVFIRNRQKPASSNQVNQNVQPQEVANVYQVDDFPVWLDLELIKSGFKPSNLSLSFGKLLILDLKNKSLALLDTSNKSQQILAGSEQIGEGRIASLIGDKGFVYSDDKGIIRVDILNKKTEIVSKPDKEWGKIADIIGFAGNVYLLDTDNVATSSGQVWKYLPTEQGYSDKREYFKEKVNLKEAKKMQIDSSVWILKRGEGIFKYTQGISDHFSISGLDKNLGDIISFFVTDQVDNIYILDGSNNRLVVLDKKGVYVSQYQSSQFSSFADFVVDEEKKKIFLLSGSKIYQIELK